MPELIPGLRRGYTASGSGSAHRNARSAIRARSCWAIAPKVPSARCALGQRRAAPRPHRLAGRHSSPVAWSASRVAKRSALGQRPSGAWCAAIIATSRSDASLGSPALQGEGVHAGHDHIGHEGAVPARPLLGQQRQTLEVPVEPAAGHRGLPGGPPAAPRQLMREARRRLGPEDLAVGQGDRS